MSAGQIRILVVDDFLPFRRMTVSMLKNVPGVSLIEAASDGVEAVQKAQALQPELILLDIGLPQLNGIEAARRIGKVAPQSRILFISQNDSPDIIEAALDTGAWGYVVKANVGRELLSAVGAVLRGERFVGGQAAQFEEPSADVRPESC